MKNLKDYMFIFRMKLNSSYQPSEEEITSMKQAWGNWIGSIAQQAKLVSSHQLGYDGIRLFMNQKEELGYFIEQEKSVSGNLVLKAKNMEEATEIAKNCPILMMGGSIEIRNTLNVF